jgi:hypothetical protein
MSNETNFDRDDGGTAFPEGDVTNGGVMGGMSMRDYFAAKAMQGLIASNDDEAGDRVEEIPAYAYAIADSMLKERAK